MGKVHVGQDVRFGFVHQPGKLLHFWPELVGDFAPLGSGRLGIILSEGGGDEGRTARKEETVTRGHSLHCDYEALRTS